MDRAAASRQYGINADEIPEVVQAGIGGSTVSTLIDGATRRFDIPVRLADEYRVDLNAIASIPLRTGEGALPSSQVAKIEMDEGCWFVRREVLATPCGAADGREGRDVTASSRKPARRSPSAAAAGLPKVNGVVPSRTSSARWHVWR